MRREQVMNDYAAVGHTIAGKVAEAVWGRKQFSKPIEPFRFIGANESKELVQSFDNQLAIFIKEGGFIGGE